MSDALLETKDLNIVYQTDEETVHAVSRINLTVHTKETLSLVGETGVGRTTTALTIMHLLPERIGRVKQGQVLSDGGNLLDLKESEMLSVRRQKTAMIFRGPMASLDSVLAVKDRILGVFRLHNHNSLGRTQMEKKMEEMLELVGIPTARENCYPHEFSGGMKQRVVIAMALACNPRLLIADEPTTALDVTIQARALGMMEELKERFDISMLLITHDLGAVTRTCDRVAVMYVGEIVEHGTIEDMFTGEKHHPCTQGLFGSIPSITGDAKRPNPITRPVPDSTNLLQGCKFHTRYPHCMEVCRHSLPPVRKEGTHEITCHLFVGKENVISDGGEVMHI